MPSMKVSSLGVMGKANLDLTAFEGINKLKTARSSASPANSTPRAKLRLSERSGLETEARRKKITEDISARTGIDEAMIENLVRRFYAKVREDAPMAARSMEPDTSEQPAAVAMPASKVAAPEAAPTAMLKQIATTGDAPARSGGLFDELDVAKRDSRNEVEGYEASARRKDEESQRSVADDRSSGGAIVGGVVGGAVEPQTSADRASPALTTGADQASA